VLVTVVVVVVVTVAVCVRVAFSLAERPGAVPLGAPGESFGPQAVSNNTKPKIAKKENEVLIRPPRAALKGQRLGGASTGSFQPKSSEFAVTHEPLPAP
jgi:hypothetical protein